MAKLDIPEVCREDFRAAVIYELADYAKDRLAEYGKYAEERIYGFPADDPRATKIEAGSDYANSVEYLTDVAEVFVRLGEWSLPGDVWVDGKAEALYHVLHTMASKLCAPRIAQAVNSLPPDTANIEATTGLMEWALEQVGEMQMEMDAEYEARKAAA